MRAPSLSVWFMACSLVGFGIVLPLAIGQNPEHEFLVQLLRGLGCAGLIIGLVALVRSCGVTPGGSAAANAPQVAPRTLCNNPLAANHGAMPLHERIDMAAEASSYYGRSFGVIYYDLNSYGLIARTHGTVVADAAMEFVLGMLEMLLRSTDRVESVGKGRFVICVALLPDQETLQMVRERAAKAMRKIRIEAMAGEPMEYDCGAAIYPAHAKTGAELIAHAERECAAARAQRIGLVAAEGPAIALVGPSCAA
jgi:GGDEF domain-containing protein